jgi:hypothetical protein
MANSPIVRVDPYPISPEGRKTATKSTIDLSEYEPNPGGNFTEDRQCLPEFEIPGEWDPAVIGAKGAWHPFEAADQPAGGKGKDRVSY